jgi:hypothetical protein
VDEKAFSVEVACGSGSKRVAHVEDVEGVLLPGFDGDGKAWWWPVMVNSASTARASRERERERKEGGAK